MNKKLRVRGIKWQEKIFCDKKHEKRKIAKHEIYPGIYKDYIYVCKFCFEKARRHALCKGITRVTNQNRITACCERIKKLRKNATPAEKVFKDKLSKLKIKFHFQKGFIKDYFCIVDFFLPHYKVCLEVDGAYHFTPEQQKKDKKRDNFLKSCRNLTVIRITNRQAFCMTYDQIRDLLYPYASDYEKKKILERQIKKELNFGQHPEWQHMKAIGKGL